MHICAPGSSGFDYEKDECLGGQAVPFCLHQPSNLRRGLPIQLRRSHEIKVPTSAGEYPIQVYVEHGEKGLAEGQHTQTYQVSDVSPTLVSYESGLISILTFNFPPCSTIPMEHSDIPRVRRLALTPTARPTAVPCIPDDARSMNSSHHGID